MSSVVAYFVSALKAGGKGRKTFVKVPASKLGWALAEKFYQAGYIHGFSLSDSSVSMLRLRLAYNQSGRPFLDAARVCSVPSRPVFATYRHLVKFSLHRRSTLLLATTKGILWDHEARRYRIGGEILCAI